jgi:hypothetical protein
MKLLDWIPRDKLDQGRLALNPNAFEMIKPRDLNVCHIRNPKAMEVREISLR